MKKLTSRSALALLTLQLLLPASARSAAQVGEDLFKALGCRGCHLAAGSGGSLGPPLDGLNKRLSPEQLRQILASRREGSPMPDYAHLTESERAALLVFLMTL